MIALSVHLMSQNAIIHIAGASIMPQKIAITEPVQLAGNLRAVRETGVSRRLQVEDTPENLL